MPNDSVYQSMFLRLFDDLLTCVSDYTQEECDADRSYAINRLRHEGTTFLTTTLPSLGKHLDSAFQAGAFEPHPAFKREKGRTTPAFLRVLFKAVFDECGVIRDQPDPEAVGHIRQVCFMFYKLADDYTPELVEKCINDFCTVDEELSNLDLSDASLRPIIIEAKKMITRVFRDFNPRDIVPRPGPGASASGTHKSQRYEMRTHWEQVHEVYPMYEYFYIGKDHLIDRVRAYRAAPRKAAPSSKMRLVPKDSRGPRIICMEEQEIMFLQQGLADAMRKCIESHPLTTGRVNFTNQEINRQLAKTASLMQSAKATLDMKEASDRVSRRLVATLFGGTTLLRSLLALSTPAIELPGGSVLRTEKYAPMGSSLCFPVMSIVHYALGMAVIKLTSNRSSKAIANCMHVYGDDIIVDTDHVAALFEWFPKFGLKFNEGKSFWKGPFRESCGFDAFLGRNVSPQRIKRRFFDSTTPRDLLSALDCEYLLFERGYSVTAEYLRAVIENRHGERFPFVCSTSPIVGWRRSHPTDFDVTMLKSRYHRSWQTKQLRARIFETAPDCSMAGGWEQLMRFLTGTLRGTQRLLGSNSIHVIKWGWITSMDATSGRTTLKWLPG